MNKSSLMLQSPRGSYEMLFERLALTIFASISGKKFLFILSTFSNFN